MAKLNENQAAQRIAQLAEQIREHDYRYYILAEPSISDFEYDERVASSRGGLPEFG
jgi:DNA ligase (NAD+)